MGIALVSAAVLTYNEERNIVACLDSLSWADELLVVDSFSSDRTVELARARGARVEQRRFVNWADQRTAAMQLAYHLWVFFVDADERATPELAAPGWPVCRPQRWLLRRTDPSP